MKTIRLTLFFTFGGSLQQWERLGMFEREVALYRRLQLRGVQVRFVTYGDSRELDFADRLPGGSRYYCLARRALRVLQCQFSGFRSIVLCPHFVTAEFLRLIVVLGIAKHVI
jgi:hypothetical protein